jgi:hypothetical protein
MAASNIAPKSFPRQRRMGYCGELWTFKASADGEIQSPL